MPVQTKENIKVETEQNVTVLKEIHNIYINTEGRVYWDVWTWDMLNGNRNTVKKKEYYSFPLAEVVTVSDGKYSVTDIEGVLWSKTTIVNAMPETTAEQIRTKRSYKTPFSITYLT